MLVSAIAAIGRNLVIGDERGLPWRLPRDLRRFRELTWGKPVVLGRKTHELIGKPLPGRDNIVLTHNPLYNAPGCHIATDVAAALTIARRVLERTGGDEVMVIGGAVVYRAMLPACTRLYLTIVDAAPEGSAHFPATLPPGRWVESLREQVPADEANLHSHTFIVLDRIYPASPICASPAAEILPLMTV